MAYFTTKVIENQGARPSVDGPVAIEVLVQASAVKATAFSTGDVVNLFKFPEGASILNDSLSYAVTGADVDSNGSPALVTDLQFSSSLDGTSPTVLIANSTVREDGDVDGADVATGRTEVGGSYLQIQVDTGEATRGTGSFSVFFELTNGPVAFEPFNVPEVSVISA